MLNEGMEDLGGLSINQASIEQLSTNHAPMGSSVYFSNSFAGKPRAKVSQLEVAHVKTMAESVINECTKKMDMEQKPRNPHRPRKNLVLFRATRDVTGTCARKDFFSTASNKVRCDSVLSSGFRCLLAKGRAAQASANSSMVVNSCCRSQLNPNLNSS